MRDSCFVPLKTPMKPGWVNPDGTTRSLVSVGDSTLNMVGKNARQTAEYKWAECIKEMYGCSKIIIILGGHGMVEMVKALKKYIGEKYDGDCTACQDIIV
eukprot:4602558-Karenia_brevis.AAC.1